jgi:hypothetical protein
MALSALRRRDQHRDRRRCLELARELPPELAAAQPLGPGTDNDQVGAFFAGELS